MSQLFFSTVFILSTYSYSFAANPDSVLNPSITAIQAEIIINLRKWIKELIVQ